MMKNPGRDYEVDTIPACAGGPRCPLGSIWAVAANSFDEAAQLRPGFIRGQGSSAVLCHTSDYSEPTLILELDNWNDNKRPADSVSGETQRGESPTMWVFLD